MTKEEYLKNYKEDKIAEIGESLENDCDAYNIAIGKNAKNEIRVCNMKNYTILNEKIASISEAHRRISEHINTDQWDHTLEYYEGDGTEEL